MSEIQWKQNINPGSHSTFVQWIQKDETEMNDVNLPAYNNS